MPPPHRNALSTAFIDPSQVEAILAGAIPDDEDRAFVVRCILGEGPAHHRGANYALLRLLGMLLDRLGGGDMTALRARGTAPVAMKVPPHLAREGSLMSYPLGLPTATIERLAPVGTPAYGAMAECLSDGPPQHALANAAMLWLIGAALDRLDERDPADARPSSRRSRPPTPPR
jgi:hypothetical protein